MNGSMCAAGTSDRGMYVVLIGDKGATPRLGILSFFERIKKDTCEDLLVETESDLGEIQVVIFGNEKNWFLPINDLWFINYSTIYRYSGTSIKNETTFPCYHWIGDDEAISTTSTTSKLHMSYDKYNFI